MEETTRKVSRRTSVFTFTARVPLVENFTSKSITLKQRRAADSGIRVLLVAGRHAKNGTSVQLQVVGRFTTQLIEQSSTHHKPNVKDIEIV